MPHFIIPADHCAFLTCEGNYSLDEVTTAWREVQRVLAEREWERALVDVTALQTSPETEELFDLAKLFWRDFPQGGRIALVVRWDQSRLAKSLEMLLRNFGLYMTVFVSEEQAGAWISEASSFKKHIGTRATVPGSIGTGSHPNPKEKSGPFAFPGSQ